MSNVVPFERINSCPDCEGMGYDAEADGEPCILCDGDNDDCPKCTGEGEYWEDCKTCGGTGKLATRG